MSHSITFSTVGAFAALYAVFGCLPGYVLLNGQGSIKAWGVPKRLLCNFALGVIGFNFVGGMAFLAAPPNVDAFYGFLNCVAIPVVLGNIIAALLLYGLSRSTMFRSEQQPSITE